MIDGDKVIAGNRPTNRSEPRATTWGAILWVGSALVIFFVLVTLLSRAYHDARRSRAEAHYREGARLAAAGRNAEAADHFRAALAFEHDDPKYRFALARSLVSLGRWEEAHGHLVELQLRDPTNGPIHRMLARLAIRAGHYEEAIDDYNRAIYGYWHENPEGNRIATRLELIQLLDQQGRSNQALAGLLALADETPENESGTRLKVASMLLSHHSPQHAEQIYRSILSTHPHDPQAEQGLAEAQFEQGDFVSARKAFQAAVRHGASEAAVAQRIALCNAILGLDPTLVRLTASQRRQRSLELLRQAVAAASSCTTLPKDISDMAQRILASKQQREENSTTLALAQKVWTLRESACEQPEADQALAAVMAKISKQ